ncbi:MAG TPA: hypothetical protein VH331_08145 [Allosphingosinicella sp.]|jgi:hypothetical protein|nr:hypothetical protein [Allosphingosinicella sp.]
MRHRCPILLCAVTVATIAAHPAPLHRLTERTVRAFVEHQERLWNRRDFADFFALTAPEAVFTTERRAPDGTIRVERETVVQSRRSAEQAFAAISEFREKATIDRIEIAPDGRNARIVGHEEADVLRAGGRRRLCADTEQGLVLREGRILSLGQTDRVRSC